jgi:hypothetical protein
MSSSCTNEDFHDSEVSYAQKTFYPEVRYLPREENLFCGEYARFKTGNACLQFVELIKEFGGKELAQKVTELRCYNIKAAEYKIHIKSYSTEQELFQQILDMHLTALRMKLD